MTALDHGDYLSVIRDEQFLLGYPVALASLLSTAYLDLSEGVKLGSLRSWLVLTHTAVAAQDLGNLHVGRLVAYNAKVNDAPAGTRKALQLGCQMMGREASPADVLALARNVEDEWLRSFLLCRIGGMTTERDTLKDIMSLISAAGSWGDQRYHSIETEYALLKLAYDGRNPSPRSVCALIKLLPTRLRPRYCREVHQRFPSRINADVCGVCAKELVNKQ